MNRKPAWARTGCLLLGALLAGAPLQAQEGAASIYTCVDRHGRRLTADRLIPDCLDREQYEMGPSGVVRRQIDPARTDQERATLEAERRKDALERARALDERRRTRALLARYPDQQAHDAERAAALKPLDDLTAAAGRRVDELREQRKALNTELDFYKQDLNRAPPLLRSKISENDAGLADQQRYIARQEQDRQRVHQRFDAQLEQLRKLWGAAPAASASQAGGADAAGAISAPDASAAVR